MSLPYVTVGKARQIAEEVSNNKGGKSYIGGEGIVIDNNKISVDTDVIATKKSVTEKSTVTVSSTGTATDEVKYITVDGVEKKLAGGGGFEDIDIWNAAKEQNGFGYIEGITSTTTITWDGNLTGKQWYDNNMLYDVLVSTDIPTEEQIKGMQVVVNIDGTDYTTTIDSVSTSGGCMFAAFTDADGNSRRAFTVVPAPVASFFVTYDVPGIYVEKSNSSYIHSAYYTKTINYARSYTQHAIASQHIPALEDLKINRQIGYSGSDPDGNTVYHQIDPEYLAGTENIPTGSTYYLAATKNADGTITVSWKQ